MLKLLVVEDHVLVREGMLQTLRGLARGTVALGASDAESALALLSSNPDVEMIVLDLMLPGMKGLSLLGILRKRYPMIPVVVISALGDSETVRKAFRLGASGYVTKASSGKMLIGALKKVLAGEIHVPEDVELQPSQSEKESRIHLTPTQARVLDLLAEGYSNQQIADCLEVTVGTVKLHLVSIFKALNVTSRAQALIAVSKKRVRF